MNSKEIRMSHTLRHIAILMVALTASSCATTSFHPLGPGARQYSGLSQDCPVAFLLQQENSEAVPSGTYIGDCHVGYPGGGLLNDRSDKMYTRLRHCACAEGGNFVEIVRFDGLNEFASAWHYAVGKVYRTD